MTFELAISTMHKTHSEILEMLEKENVHCDCIIINQCDEERTEELKIEKQRVRIFYTTERGLSRSRNMALHNAIADIIAFADDDLFYYDGFDKIILDYYQKNTKADAVIFNIDSFMKKFGTLEKKCKFLDLGTYISFQTSLNRNAILKKNVLFREMFGTGSKVFDSGEENIFLSDCFKAGLKIYYCPKKILLHKEGKSTWFKGFNDKKYIIDRGAIFYALSPVLSVLFIFAFAILKRRTLKPISFFKSIKLMLEGRNRYLQMLKLEK